MKTHQINWLAILLEAFFVVLGVLLALGANNWRDHHNNQLHAETALISIVEELHANHEAVNTAINYHSYLMDTLYKFMGRYANQPDKFPDADVFNKGFTNPAVPLSRAWEAANATGVIEYMPYDQVLLISQVYKSQEQYENQSHAIGQQIYGRMFNEGMGGILQNYKNMTQIIGTFAYNECGLAFAYKEVIPQLKQSTNQDSTQLEIPVFCNYMPKR